jgi:hypothetical protein
MSPYTFQIGDTQRNWKILVCQKVPVGLAAAAIFVSGATYIVGVPKND